MTSRSEEAVPGIVEATRLRDEMIGVARALADRSWGATQSEMREAQIEFLAAELAKRRAAADQHIERLTSALEEAVAFYDGLDREHEAGEADLLDRMSATLSLIQEQE